MKLNKLYFILIAFTYFMPATVNADELGPVTFVMQLTRSGENYGHRRALLQIDRVLDDLGEKNLKIEVVAYEEGTHALLADNIETSQLVTKLSNRGVVFKACRISMKAWGLKDEQFPLEVEFVPAGAPEVIRLQMKGYKYWRP
jgi:intracellular sulfur oxidation DsrE/DsrF family protein